MLHSPGSSGAGTLVLLRLMKTVCEVQQSCETWYEAQFSWHVRLTHPLPL
ncbi:hypothetical protein M758_7G119400 [Ceratodon purpureus]|uniref:Uncharacterized protein n=1 Tax=Ceratodon purpureus TaxID=3225 RepID=A0A8T0HAP0_CERPU|nr:hypothetical protein KC19_7G157500 [Ceratodon purpureus]KAG0611148.1 hypothetical protein M758_7G119400 [Ceratodon purpureus]